MHLKIEFEAMAPKIREQIKSAGLTADMVGITHCQLDADALTRLAIRGIIPESAVSSGRKKLLKHVLRYITTTTWRNT